MTSLSDFSVCMNKSNLRSNLLWSDSSGQHSVRLCLNAAISLTKAPLETWASKVCFWFVDRSSVCRSGLSTAPFEPRLKLFVVYTVYETFNYYICDSHVFSKLCSSRHVRFSCEISLQDPFKVTMKGGLNISLWQPERGFVTVIRTHICISHQLSV